MKKRAGLPPPLRPLPLSLPKPSPWAEAWARRVVASRRRTLRSSQPFTFCEGRACKEGMREQRWVRKRRVDKEKGATTEAKRGELKINI